MRKLLFIIVIFSLLLSGCGADINEKNTDSEPPARLADQWPGNEYTENLPVPDGTVTWAVLSEKDGYCAVSLSDMSEGSYEVYMESLTSLGFTDVYNVAEEIEGQNYVSIGNILTDGKKTLSISYLDNVFTMYISLAKDSSR